MKIRPNLEQLREIARGYGFHMSDADLSSFLGLMDSTLESYSRLDQLADSTLPVRYARTGGYRPDPEENILNAWYQKCSIKGAAEGPLAGKRIAIKDNVCVAGIPMMNGSALLEGYVPEFDATIVTRILDAGGEIVGKSVCESLCFSGGSHTSDTGPVLNPHNHMLTPGGSSSGSAALVAAGECEMAIGGDQGGSIRIPSSWCGTYGLKPTYGLVPYTGIFPIELTLDHTGPIAASTADVALLLEAIAGEDGLDPRQKDVKVEKYTSALASDTEGLRIGIVREGFAWAELSEHDVDEMVKQAAQRFTQLGAQVDLISLPMHRDGIHIWRAIAVEGATMLMVRGNSMGTNWKGHYSTSLLDAYARGRLSRADDFSDTVKLVALLGQYMQNNYHGHYYAKAQNLARRLAKAYDEALQSVDLLVMPTTPMKATRIPGPDAQREEKVQRSLEMIVNTAPTDVTGHPAMSVPCGLSAGLPVGMMLIAKRWHETTILRAAHAFEQISGYQVHSQQTSAPV
ncbi:amidase [Ktedonosporobacter rubrisoli]|uniref:Amidase n=1 Tax=Ktedonosporobacter rubrisoli TaxID=2509675 RepID=A0A4P6K1E2_KTERU|nr:amidase [Ktedonosporobacter rubrisoli]QBD81653.1 amidase [Ktedonosporobacter rubrisoli]